MAPLPGGRRSSVDRLAVVIMVSSGRLLITLQTVSVSLPEEPTPHVRRGILAILGGILKTRPDLGEVRVPCCGSGIDAAGSPGRASQGCYLPGGPVTTSSRG